MKRYSLLTIKVKKKIATPLHKQIILIFKKRETQEYQEFQTLLIFLVQQAYVPIMLLLALGK